MNAACRNSAVQNLRNARILRAFLLREIRRVVHHGGVCGGEGGGAFVAGARSFVFPQLIEAERQSQKGKEGALVWNVEVALGGEVGAGEGAFVPLHRLPQPPRLLKAPAQRVTHAAARNAV